MELATKPQKQLIVATFLFGFFTGAYLYVTVFAPAYSDGIVPDLRSSSKDNDFNIQATQYGACLQSGLTCPTYELDARGMLRALPGVPLDEEDILVEIELTSADMRLVKNAVREATLEAYAATSDREDCAQVESNEYRYMITNGADTYTLDTCRTDFDKTSELQEVLEALFEE